MNINNFFKKLILPETAIQCCKLKVVEDSITEDSKDFDWAKHIENREDDLYFVQGVDIGKTGRAGDADILFKNSIFFDFDIRREREIEIVKEECKGLSSEESAKKEKEIKNRPPENIMTTEEIFAEADRVKGLLESDDCFRDWSLIAFTGNGFHIHYVGEIIQIAPSDISHFSKGMKHFINKLGALTGCLVDEQCSNVARIARIPTGWNSKVKLFGEVLYERDADSDLIEVIIPMGKKLLYEEHHTKSLVEENETVEFINKQRDDFACELAKDTGLVFDGKKNFHEEGKPSAKAAFWLTLDGVAIRSNSRRLIAKYDGYSYFNYRHARLGGEWRETFQSFEEQYPQLKKMKKQKDKANCPQESKQDSESTISDDDSDRPRVAILEKPEKEYTFEQWIDVINHHFPQTVQSAKLCASVMAQLLINDITNPFALVLVDVPSASKTTTLDFFSGLDALTYSTDKFTPASFVSQAANVKTEKLDKVDLLPRLRYKTFIMKDFATVFSEKAEALEENLGVLTRVLDGDGYKRESGVHGGRGYSGDYLFMMLGATTRLRKKVWDVIGSLGARIFFYHTNQPDPSEEELMLQISGNTREKKAACSLATNSFLQSLWSKFPHGIESEIVFDEKLMHYIPKIACLMAKLRAIVKVDGYGDEKEYCIQAENPSRLNRLFYNFCRGAAIAKGRMEVADEDIGDALLIALNSVPPQRGIFISHLMTHDGKGLEKNLEEPLGVRSSTVNTIANTLQELKIIVRNPVDNPNKHTDLVLREEFIPLVDFYKLTQE